MSRSAGSADKLFYVGNDQTIYNPAWVNADNITIDCGDHVNYKRFNTVKPDGLKDTIVADINDLDVWVSPNPSGSSFTINIGDVPIDANVSIVIETVDGNILRREVGHMSDGSGKFQFIWDARSASPGIYFYRVEITGRGSYSGKMVKI